MRSPGRAERPSGRFRAGVGLTICTMLALGVLLTLGTWQLQRLQWKTSLIETAQARAAEAPVPLAAALAEPAQAQFRAVTAAGRYRHDRAFAMGTIGMGGEVGARIVAPLTLANGGILLVERGWLPQRMLPPATPPDIEPDGEVRLTGRLRDQRDARPGLFTPANRPDDRRWYWYDMPALGERLGGAVLPFVLTLETSDTGADLPVVLPLPVTLPNNHLGYAITWYGLAAGLLAVYLAFGLRQTGD